jgi:hypothetical protein
MRGCADVTYIAAGENFRPGNSRFKINQWRTGIIKFIHFLICLKNYYCLRFTSFLFYGIFLTDFFCDDKWKLQQSPDVHHQCNIPG